MPDEWPDVTYDQALAAYEAGQKLHAEGRVYLVRPTLPPPGAPLPARPTLWLADERSTGDHGLVLFADGRVEAR